MPFFVRKEGQAGDASMNFQGGAVGGWLGFLYSGFAGLSGQRLGRGRDCPGLAGVCPFPPAPEPAGAQSGAGWGWGPGGGDTAQASVPHSSASAAQT